MRDKKLIKEYYDMSLHRRYLDTFKAFKSLALPLGANILDVGCGIGHLSLEIKHLGYNICVVDKNIDNIKCKMKSYDINSFNCDIEHESLPIDRECFDCILFTEVIEHLDPRKLCFVLNEFWRVLKKGGFLLITTPNQASFQNSIRLLLGRRIIFSPDHVREYVVEEIFEFLEKSGFNIYRKAYLLSFDKVDSSTFHRINIGRRLWRNLGSP